jgi:hypothetical protein
MSSVVSDALGGYEDHLTFFCHTHIKMPTSIDNILADPARLGQVIERLSKFFADTPERLGSLRLAVLGIIDLPPDRDDPKWHDATQDFNRLFKDKLPNFQPLPESRGASGKIIKRFALRKHTSDRGNLSALLSLYVIQKVELK